MSGTIFQHGEDFVGGIIGYTFGTVRNCINNATLKAFDNMCVGGIAGSNVGLVENCINTGDLYSFEFAGGIVGQSAGTIKNCYAECTITGSRYLGGVASYSENASYGSEIVNCGFNGEIVVEDTPVTKVGAIVGFGEKSNTSITDSFGVADIYFKDITDTSCVLPFGANIDNVVNNCYSYSHIYTSSDEFEYRKLIGNDFSNFAVHKNINGGFPFPKSLFAVGQFIESDAFSTLLDNDFDRIKTDLVITREGDARYIELGIYPQTYVGKSQNENNSLIFDNGAYLPSYAQEKKINRDTVTHSAYKRQNSWKDPTSGLQIVSGGSNNSYEFEDGTIIKNGASSYGEYWFKMEPIKWKILNWKDAMLGADLIVISDKVLSSSIAWCKTSTLDADWSSDTSDCSIRPWLNNHFYQDAFTDAERALIKTTRVQCNDVYSNTADKPTLTVQDKIWFMSKDEVERYLPNLEQRAVQPTDYALFSGCVINSNRNCDWWTRTALATDVKTVVVTADGQVNNVGIGTKTIGVRPVMTIII